MADTPVNFEWIRTLSTEQLRTWRGALEGDLAAAERRPKREGKFTVAFCRARIEAIDLVLGQRGIIITEEEGKGSR